MTFVGFCELGAAKVSGDTLSDGSGVCGFSATIQLSLIPYQASKVCVMANMREFGLFADRSWYGGAKKTGLTWRDSQSPWRGKVAR